MGDFSRKHKLKDFIKQAKRNGWVTTPDEQKKMECIYKMSDEKDGIADEILNKVYTEQVWTPGDRELQWGTFIWSRVFEFGTTDRDHLKISNELYEEYRNYSVSNHTQEELDKIRANVEKEIQAEEAREAEEARKGMDKFVEQAFKRGWSENERGLIETIYENNELLKKNGDDSLEMVVFNIRAMDVSEKYPQLGKNSILDTITKRIADKNIDSIYADNISDSINNYLNLKENKELAAQETTKKEEARLREIEEIKQKSFEEYMGKAKKAGWSDDDKDFLRELHDKTHHFNKNGTYEEIYGFTSANFWCFNHKVKNNSPEDKRDALGIFRMQAKDADVSAEQKKPVMDFVESGITKYNADFKKIKDVETNKKIQDMKASFNLGNNAKKNAPDPNKENQKVQEVVVDPLAKERQDVEKIANGLLNANADNIIQRASYGLESMVALKDVMLGELRQFRARLTLTQDDQMANFVSDKVEGSPEYQAMCKALNESIEKLESKDFSPSDLFDVVNSVKEKSDNYHKLKHGTFGGPKTDNGIERDDVSVSMYKKLSDYQFNFRSLYEKNFKEPFVKGLNISEKDSAYLSVKDLRAKINDKAKQFNINIKDTKNKPMEDAINIKINVDKMSLEYRIKDLSGKREFQYSDYKITGPTNSKEAAKMYLIKKAMDVCTNEKATVEDIAEAYDKLHGKNFEKNASELADNKIFKHVCKNSNNIYKTYSIIENKAAQIQKENKVAYKKILDEHKNEETYIRHLDEKANLTNFESKVKNATGLLTAKILADPKNDKFRLAIASAPGNMTKFNNYVTKFVKNSIERTAQKNLESKKHYEDVEELLNTKNLNKKIMEGFATSEKNAAKQKEAPQANKEMNQIGPM